jgi:hypothetical protein
MPPPSYTLILFLGAKLSDLYEQLTNANMPGSEAAQLLFELWRDGEIHTRQTIPQPCVFRPGPWGLLVQDLHGGALPASSITVFHPAQFNPTVAPPTRLTLGPEPAPFRIGTDSPERDWERREREAREAQEAPAPENDDLDPPVGEDPQPNVVELRGKRGPKPYETWRGLMPHLKSEFPDGSPLLDDAIVTANAWLRKNKLTLSRNALKDGLKWRLPYLHKNIKDWLTVDGLPNIWKD